MEPRHNIDLDRDDNYKPITFKDIISCDNNNVTQENDISDDMSNRKKIEKQLKMLNNTENINKQIIKLIGLYFKCKCKSDFRNVIYYMLIDFIEEIEINNIDKLLCVYIKIVGFDTEIKKTELDNVVKKIVISLLKSPLLYLYDDTIIETIKTLSKYNNLYLIEIIMAIFKIWPKGNYIKEIIFLKIILVLMYSIKNNEETKTFMPNLYKKLFKQISICLKNGHIKIIETILLYLDETYIMMIIKNNKKIILPMIIPPMHNLMDNIWNLDIKLQIKSKMEEFKKIN